MMDGNFIRRKMENAYGLSFEAALALARNLSADEDARACALYRVFEASEHDFETLNKGRLIEEFLHDRSLVVQQIAMGACYHANVRSDAIVASLWKSVYLKDANRFSALTALAHLGDERIIEVCNKALQTETGEAQVGAAIALGFLKSADATKVIEPAFKRARSESLRLALACGLARAGSLSAVPYLEAHSTSSTGCERLLCVCMLAALGSKAGLEELSRMTDALSGEDKSFERAFVRSTLTSLGVKFAPDSDWNESIRSWVSRRGGGPDD